MGLAASATVLAAGAAWRLVGLGAAGRALVANVSTGGETERTLAGMLLVRAGDRSVPVVVDAINAGATTPDLVDVLASIGTESARIALEGVARLPGADIGAAARQALQTLDEMRRKAH